MNFLAHLHLAHLADSSLPGNLMADFVRGNPQGDYPAEIIDGIFMHRRIDVMTDNLAEVKEAREWFRPQTRRVAPITLDDVRTLQEARRRVFVHETLKAYIVDIVNTTRGAGPNPLPGWNKHVRVGASPRGGIALMQISQAIALMAGRNHVMPDDIKEMRYGILRHRIIRTFDALADNVSIEGLIDAVFKAVPVP